MDSTGHKCTKSGIYQSVCTHREQIALRYLLT